MPTQWVRPTNYLILETIYNLDYFGHLLGRPSTAANVRLEIQTVGDSDV